MPKTFRPAAILIAAAIMLTALRSPADAPLSSPRYQDRGDGVLQDGTTGLQWTRKDNGADINWLDADSYCRGKHDGWRLPSIEELAAIYDATAGPTRCAEEACRIAGQFALSGAWFWSATQVGKDATDGIELAWGILMVNGVRTQSVREAKYASRALCVRSAATISSFSPAMLVPYIGSAA